MLKFSEIFDFSKEKFRKIPISKEFEWFEWFEWFGPSPIEPFNRGCGGQVVLPPGYLREMHRLVRSKGGVAIADEVQTFVERFDIKPFSDFSAK